VWAVSDREEQRVVAVVVTFNRLDLLQDLLTRLGEVDGLAEVIVVDNASTDGTGDWLASTGPTAAAGTEVVVRGLSRNTGGAGGFHEGLRLAVERGADLVWLMDDDGLPDPDCLDLLLPYAAELDFWGPLVVDEGDAGRLVFPIRLPGRATVVHRLADVRAAAREGLIREVVIPFNGVLVTRELVERIGYPREEYFIWGDDHEYRLRAEKAGARIATVVGAQVRHPSVGDLGTPMAFGRTTYNHSPSDLKAYCMGRNNLVNLREYRGARCVTAPAATSPVTRSSSVAESVAVVVVTYNRADLLGRMLDGLAAQTHQPDAVYVIDNASIDHTATILAHRHDLPLHVTTTSDNLGGAGGFHLGTQQAYGAGHDRIWLMDDDVVPAPDCLEVLLSHDEACLLTVREDTSGRLVEKAATRFDLTNPLSVRPKRSMVETDYGDRASMPEKVEIENVAFEGFMVRRDVIDTIGLPDPSFFIFYDDADYAVRARRAGFRIWAVRDAVLVRQLDFDQQHDLSGWKGFYMYRNLFVVHLRYGTNPLVRLKPWLIVLAVLLLSPVRGGRAEARNVIRAMASARSMRAIPGPEPSRR
jgi:GT2 family glycosyltransferase